MSVDKRQKKVAIVGFAPSWKEAPFADESYEIWALNEMYRVANEVPNFRADRWFEIHDMTTPSKDTPEHVAWLQQCPCPLYMQKKYEHIPNGIEFPINDIIRFFEEKGVSGSRYFTNTISYLIAFALYEGYKEIAIYGVDMATNSEYQAQRPSCEYWIALAEGLGVKVYIPQSSDLLKCTQLYALESSNRNRTWMKTQVNELKKRSKAFAQQEQQAQQALIQAQIAQAELRGAISAYNEILVRTQ